MSSRAAPAHYPSLRDKVVFVTGGASGIGASVVEAFANQHAKVAFVDIDIASAEALVESLHGKAHAPLFLPCDLLDIEALRATIQTVRQRLGNVGVLVNNAANDERHDADAVTPEYWDRTQNVNLRHQFFAAQAVRPHMRELGGGSIINLSSIAWMSGASRLVGYATAKAAIVGLTRSLGVEFGGDNIRVNAVAPGAVMTQKQLRLWHTDASTAMIVARQALHTQVAESDIAAAVVFLAADDSRLITKQCLTVDAGLR
jgi:NAD(P)-dependent dehydrogenase (short-subunit alcohol dehydrogenase family)